ncbi:MAG: hypothetical protein H7318_09335 [Oligoflexus sp.]|nr:hypothetical protein [Oligoflexus sp.]
MKFISQFSLGLALIFSFHTQKLLADTVSLDLFLSSEKLLGGIPCAEVKNNDDAWFNNRVGVYDKPEKDLLSKSKVQLKAGCITGGGDCECWAMFLEKRQLSAGEAFYKVKDNEGKNRWILGASKNETKIADLSIKPIESELVLRKPSPILLSALDLNKPISKIKAETAPESIKKKMSPKNTQRYFFYTAEETVKFDRQDFTKFKIEYVGYPKLGLGDSVEEQKFFLRHVWIQTYDKEGRINFWLVTPLGS